MPSQSNRITQNDIDNNNLRITVEFQEYFPDVTRKISITVFGTQYVVLFSYRNSRSHVLHLRAECMTALNINPGDSVKFTIVGEYAYKLERII